MKAVSIISIVYGVMGMIWGTLMMALIRFEKAIFDNLPFPEEVNQFFDAKAVISAIYSTFNFLMPFVILIGIIFLVSGIMGLTAKGQHAIAFGMFAAVFNIIWYVAFTVIMQVEIFPLITIGEIFPRNLLNILFVLGSIVNGIFYCGYPVFLLIYLTRQRRKV